jgi:4a-hydroxytetrahydrobiopterin dehydratase
MNNTYQSQNRLATTEEIQSFIDLHSEWTSVDNQLTVDYKFNDFKETFAFMAEVAKLAEELGHHPTWSNTYNQLSIKLATHDLDDQVSLLDIELASQIAELYSESLTN